MGTIPKVVCLANDSSPNDVARKKMPTSRKTSTAVKLGKKIARSKVALLVFDFDLPSEEA